MPSKKEDVKKPSPKKLPPKKSSPKKSSRRKTFKGGARVYKTADDDEYNIFIQETITTDADTDLYKHITSFLHDMNDNVVTNELTSFIYELNIHNKREDGTSIAGNFFDDIVGIVKEYNPDPNKKKNFQTKNYDDNTLFGKYELWNKETPQRFITIDPTIIQIMIFDKPIDNKDIVHSLKLIIRERNELCLRYTSQLFPTNMTKITNFTNLEDFSKFNVKLDNKDNSIFNSELENFIITYKNFYEFYKKCYIIENCKGPNNLIDYQLKYISILGKARFRDKDIIQRTAILTDYIMSNLIFTNPTCGFISGGYKGFKDNAYGITRSGYEIAKKYNRPILTIMCKEGLHDSHEYSDATLIYGEHWGEDTIALSQFTDGAVIIAPFGGWTYVECLALLENKKIVGIYNDLFNILNYEKMPTDNVIKEQVNNIITNDYNDLNQKDKNQKKMDITTDIKNIYTNKFKNKNFFKFTRSEQDSIIEYYINYYLILLYLLNKPHTELYICIEYGIKILMYLKKYCKENYVRINEINTTFNNTKNDLETELNNLMTEFLKPKNNRSDEQPAKDLLKKIKEKKAELKQLQTAYDQLVLFNSNFDKLIEAFSIVKNYIKQHINEDSVFEKINNKYTEVIKKSNNKDYQNKIPKNCDGIWIKPIFNLLSCIIDTSEPSEPLRTSEPSEPSGTSGGNKRGGNKRGGACTTTENSIIDAIKIYNIDMDKFDTTFATNLNTNIIFVFSDIMYLNIYLNNNLNTSEFQLNMRNKIEELHKKFNTHFSTKSRDLLTGIDNTTVELNRSIDGLFDTDKKIISNHHIIRENYNFNIDKTCNNFTSILSYLPSSNSKEPEMSLIRETSSDISSGTKIVLLEKLRRPSRRKIIKDEEEEKQKIIDEQIKILEL